MIGLKLKGGHAGTAVLVGNFSAIIGSIISVRIMLHFTKKEYGTEEYCIQFEEHEDMDAIMNTREIRDGGIGGRAIEALLEGGKNGVDVRPCHHPGRYHHLYTGHDANQRRICRRNLHRCRL